MVEQALAGSKVAQAVFILFICGLKLLPAQQSVYSSKSPSSKKSAGAVHVKNPIDFTKDADFIREIAEYTSYLLDTSNSAKDHANNAELRAAASDLAYEQSRMADDLRKLANRKHVTLPDRKSAKPGEKASAEPDQFFTVLVLECYRTEIARFEAQAKDGSDADIKTWAAFKIDSLKAQQRAMEAVEQKMRSQ